MENTNFNRFDRLEPDFETGERPQLDRVDIDAAKALIMRYIDNDGEANFDTVYSDASEPADLDLYQAVNELLDAGVIVGPRPGEGLTHDQMVYRAAA